MRLTALATAGYLDILEAEDLVPAHLAWRMDQALQGKSTSKHQLLLDGARESAAIIRRLTTSGGRT
jgi:predicted glycosyltransferase